MEPTLRVQWLTEEMSECGAAAVDFFYRGSTYLLFLNQYEQAISDLTEAIAREPRSAAAHAFRAFAYCKLSPPDIESSMADIVLAAELDPTLTSHYQGALSAGGYYTGPIDGVFGLETQAAYRAACEAGGV